jgi:hypothetical protein
MVREVGAGIPALTGRAAGELIGRRWPPLWTPSAASDALLAALRAGRPAHAEVELEGPAEARRTAEVLVEPLLEAMRGPRSASCGSSSTTRATSSPGWSITTP